jgi:hypothetical protein
MQQPEQERRTDQGGDDADGDANGARDRVGEEQEKRSADRREGQNSTRVGANGEAGKVRHHEANEPNETREGNGRGGGESGKGNGDTALTAHIDAEMCRPFIAEQEGGKSTAASCKKERGKSDRHGGGGKARPGDTVETTKQESKDRAEIRATREHYQ